MRTIPSFRDGVLEGHAIDCPACGNSHLLKKEIWTFNGSIDRPTFTPSVHVKIGPFNGPTKMPLNGDGIYVCHSYITDGKIQYLSDCTHKMAGQTVDLPDM
jgi:hypothetical protein